MVTTQEAQNQLASQQAKVSQAQSQLEQQKRNLRSQQTLRSLNRSQQLQRSQQLKEIGQREQDINKTRKDLESFQRNITQSQSQRRAVEILKEKIEESIKKKPGFIVASRLRQAKEAFQEAGLDPKEAERIYRESVQLRGYQSVFTEGTMTKVGGGTDKEFLGSISVRGGKFNPAEGVKVEPITPISGGYSLILESKTEIPNAPMTPIPGTIDSQKYSKNFIELTSRAFEDVKRVSSPVIEKVKDINRDLSKNALVSDVKKIVSTSSKPLTDTTRKIFFLEDSDPVVGGINRQVSTGVKEVSKQVVPNVYFGEGGLPTTSSLILQDKKNTLTGFSFSRDSFLGKLTEGRVIPLTPTRNVQETILKQSLFIDTKNSIKGETLGDVGSYFVPGFGQARFGLEVSSILEKPLVKEKITGRDVLFLGTVGAVGGLIAGRRSGLFLTQGEKILRRRSIAEKGALDLEKKISKIRKERFRTLEGLKFLDDPKKGIVVVKDEKLVGIGRNILTGKETKILTESSSLIEKTSKVKPKVEEVFKTKRDIIIKPFLEETELFKIERLAGKEPGKIGDLVLSSRKEKLPGFQALKFIEEESKITQIGLGQLSAKGKKMSGFGITFVEGSQGRPIQKELFTLFGKTKNKGDRFTGVVESFENIRKIKSRPKDIARFTRAEEISGNIVARQTQGNVIRTITDIKRKNIITPEVRVESLQKVTRRKDLRTLGERQQFLDELSFGEKTIKQEGSINLLEETAVGKVSSIIEKPFTRKSRRLPEGIRFSLDQEVTSFRGGRSGTIQKKILEQKPIVIVQPKPKVKIPTISNRPQEVKVSKINKELPLMVGGLGLTKIPFAGAGQFERTEEVAITVPGKIEQSTITKSDQSSKQESVGINVVKQKLDLNLNQIPKISIKNIQELKQISLPLIKESLRQRSATLQRSKLSLDTVTTPSLQRSPNPDIPIKTPKLPDSQLFERAKKLAKEKPSLFEIFVKESGKDVSLGKVRTQAQAESILGGKIRSKLVASGFLEEGGVKLKTSQLKTFGSSEFRTSKKDPFRIVERKSRRLRKGTTGKQIQAFKTKKNKKTLFNI